MPEVLDKPAARRRFRAARAALSVTQHRSETQALVDILANLLNHRGLSAVATYLAAGDELDPAGIFPACWQRRLPLLAPRVIGPGALVWHRLRNADDLTACPPGAYGIRAPDPERCPQVDLPAGALLLVPGLAFTREGWRLGQGGGYYDRLLAATPAITAVGLGFACQLADHLPREVHDRQLHGLVLAGALLRSPWPA